MLRFLTIILFVFILSPLQSEQIKTLEFTNKDIKDMLLTFGQINGLSIIPDETVEGRGSYSFTNLDSETALKIFLDNFSLQSTKINGVIFVSKVKVNYDSGSGKLTIRAQDTPIKTIIKNLILGTAKTILFDYLPSDLITLNLENVKIEDVLRVIIAKYPDLILDKQDTYFYLKRKLTDAGSFKTGERRFFIRSGDSYSANVEKGKFRELLMDLSFQSKKEFLILSERDTLIEGFNFTNKSFEDILKLLLQQGNADYAISNEIIVIFEVQRKDLLKKYLVNRVYNLENISSQELLKLIPNSLSGSPQLKIDEKGNKLIFSGSNEEIMPLIDFVKLVDKPQTVFKTKKVELNYLKSDEIIPLLPSEFGSYGPLSLPGRMALSISMPENKFADLEKLIRSLDKPLNSFPIKLKYLKAEELIAALPPIVTESNFQKTKDSSLVFFKGSESLKNDFLKDLAMIDTPKVQIRYEILVLQVREDKGLDLGFSPSVAQTNQNQNFGIKFGFDKVWNLKMDLIGYFGYSYGLNLSASLTNSTSNVLADTNLIGLSGERITFQNTATYRYTDYPLDTTTGAPSKVGVLRELASGLILNVEGWSSGDNMITMKVETTLSKQDSSTSANTTENKITTNVRTPNGKPIVIGGLKREEKTTEINKFPILGDIPLLGLLFQTTKDSSSKSEFIIYIVPHIEMVDKVDDFLEKKLSDVYQKLGNPLK